jgi:DNA-binding beta-propeller fold protein YncE
MKKRRILLAVLSLFVGWGGASMAHAAGVTYQVTDNPGSWFECTTSTSASFGCVHQALGSDSTTGRSLAVIKRGESITFQSGGGRANTIHTIVSLVYPTPASVPTGQFTAMPFDTDIDVGTTSAPIVPNELGLHVFFCDIHPYMFATVIVVDPSIPTGTLSPVGTIPLDLGKTVDLHKIVAETLPGLPTASDLALRLVHTYFIITNLHNWQQYPATGVTDWTPAYPGVTVSAYQKNDNNPTTVNLDTLLRTYFNEGGTYLDGSTGHPHKPLAAPVSPAAPGVGQVWVDTQFEMMAEKTKPGTSTAVDASTFKVVRKVGLPGHGTNSGDGMNNPHNMWTDKDQKVIYQTEWFDHYLSVFDRKTGAFVRRIEAGLAPAHVMTRTNNDQVHVSQNGDNNVREFDSLAHGNGFLRDIPMVPTVDPITGEEQSAHPHAHWMSADGDLMVSPNPDTENSTVYNFKNNHGNTAPVGHFPIATGMMPDSSKYYVANFLDSSITVMNIVGGKPQVKGTINLLEGYAVPGQFDVLFPTVAPIGALPIQTPVSPDGKFAIVANTMAAKILVIDTATDKVVKSLDCDAGCHGVQFGAKKGGGYYAYVSSKFSNRMIIVDPKNGSNAAIVGSVLLTATGTTAMDGTIPGNSPYAGMGGQGVLPIPVVYNGWVQHLPEEWAEKLTYQQRHPIGVDPK